jgi:hypothetical protein
MDEPQKETALANAADRISQLEAELEAASDVTSAGAALLRARELLHQWVDTVTAVVATPGVGRVVLIHANGGESRIASPELPMLLAEPVRWD